MSSSFVREGFGSDASEQELLGGDLLVRGVQAPTQGSVTITSIVPFWRGRSAVLANVFSLTPIASYGGLNIRIFRHPPTGIGFTVPLWDASLVDSLEVVYQEWLLHGQIQPPIRFRQGEIVGQNGEILYVVLGAALTDTNTVDAGTAQLTVAGLFDYGPTQQRIGRLR